jgi:hypothetical protein
MNYSLLIDWAGKDSLPDSSTSKIVSGADFDSEFNEIKDSIETKAEMNGDAGENFACNALTASSGTINSASIATLGISQAFTGSQYSDAVPIALNDNYTANLLTSNVFIVTVGGNGYALQVENMESGMEVTFVIKNTGAFDMDFTTNFYFPTQGNPAITSGDGAVDLVRCVSDGTVLYCNIAQDLSNLQG